MSAKTPTGIDFAERQRGAIDIRCKVGAFIAREMQLRELFLVPPFPSEDGEFVRGALSTLELMRADLIAAGHMTADDFPPVVRS